MEKNKVGRPKVDAVCKICGGKYHARGFCRHHYDQHREYWLPECRFKGCQKPIKYVKARLCSGHYYQKKKGQVLRPLNQWEINHAPTCSKCDKPYYSRGFCALHYGQWYHKQQALKSLAKRCK